MACSGSRTVSGVRPAIGTQAFLLPVQCYPLRCVASEIKMRVGRFLGDEESGRDEVGGDVP